MKNLKMKSARAALDLSQQQLADMVGVSRQTINAIEKGDYNPTIRLCIAICKVLNRTLDAVAFSVFDEVCARLLESKRNIRLDALPANLQNPVIIAGARLVSGFSADGDALHPITKKRAEFEPFQ